MKEDKIIIEDLIVAAHNNAKSELKSKTSEEISKVSIVSSLILNGKLNLCKILMKLKSW